MTTLWHPLSTKGTCLRIHTPASFQYNTTSPNSFQASQGSIFYIHQDAGWLLSEEWNAQPDRVLLRPAVFSHTDMLIIRGILPAAQVFTEIAPCQEVPLPRRWERDVRNNDCLAKICRSPVTSLKSTGFNAPGTKRFLGLPRTRAGAQMSAVIGHLLPLPLLLPLT